MGLEKTSRKTHKKKEFKRNCNQKIGWEPTKVGYTGNDPGDHDQVKAGRNSMNK